LTHRENPVTNFADFKCSLYRYGPVMSTEEKAKPGLLTPQEWRRVAARVPAQWKVTQGDVRDLIHQSAMLRTVMNRVNTELKSGMDSQIMPRGNLPKSTWLRCWRKYPKYRKKYSICSNPKVPQILPMYPK
jgi:hypothetical protein